jgi:hypothetical protein
MSPDPDNRLSPRGTIVVGAFSMGVGLLIVLMSADVIPTDESKFHAPRWVASACGLMFVLAGVALAAFSAPGAPEGAGRTTWRSFLLGGGIVALMAAVSNWIAFGPGERRFGGTISVPFGAVSGPAGEWSGRLVFGIGAALVDLLLVWMVARGLRDLLGRRG